MTTQPQDITTLMAGVPAAGGPPVTSGLPAVSGPFAALMKGLMPLATVLAEPAETALAALPAAVVIRPGRGADAMLSAAVETDEKNTSDAAAKRSPDPSGFQIAQLLAMAVQAPVDRTVSVTPGTDTVPSDAVDVTVRCDLSGSPRSGAALLSLPPAAAAVPGAPPAATAAARPDADMTAATAAGNSPEQMPAAIDSAWPAPEVAKPSPDTTAERTVQVPAAVEIPRAANAVTAPLTTAMAGTSTPAVDGGRVFPEDTQNAVTDPRIPAVKKTTFPGTVRFNSASTDRTPEQPAGLPVGRSYPQPSVAAEGQAALSISLPTPAAEETTLPAAAGAIPGRTQDSAPAGPPVSGRIPLESGQGANLTAAVKLSTGPQKQDEAGIAPAMPRVETVSNRPAQQAPATEYHRLAGLVPAPPEGEAAVPLPAASAAGPTEVQVEIMLASPPLPGRSAGGDEKDGSGSKERRADVLPAVGIPAGHAAVDAAGQERFTLQPKPAEPRDGLHESILSQVRSSAVSHDGKGNGTITVRLNPVELGEVQISLRIENQRVKVEVITENRTVRDALMGNLENLKESFLKQSLTMERLDVSTGGGGFGQGFREERGEQPRLSPLTFLHDAAPLDTAREQGTDDWGTAENSLVNLRL